MNYVTITLCSTLFTLLMFCMVLNKKQEVKPTILERLIEHKRKYV